LAIKLRGAIRIYETYAFFNIVIVEESHEVSSGIAMGTEYIFFNELATVKHVAQDAGRSKAFYHGLKIVEERVIESGIDPNEFADVTRVPADEPCDILLSVLIEDLTEREEVFLADTECKFADGVAKQARKIALQITKRVDAKTVDIKASDNVLISADEEALQIGISRHHLLQDAKIPNRIVAVRIALPSKKLVLMEFGGPHQGIQRRIGN
jgi:hypothetical protein